MAKYLTVVCRVKGQTILKLIDDFDSIGDKQNVFYYKDIDDFDLSRVKQEVEEVVNPFHNFDNCYNESQESEEYLNESNSFGYSQSVDNLGSDKRRQSMDGYKNYLTVNRRNGRQIFCCNYKTCRYETQWKNAIINHIRTNHLFYFPFVCSQPNCDKSFAIRSNLNNHLKVHQNKYRINEGFQHNFSHNLAKKEFNCETEESDNDKKDPNYSQTVRRFPKNGRTLKQRDLKKKRNKKSIKSEANTESESEGKPSMRQKPAFVGVKSIEPYIKKTERNGNIWRICLFPDCSYGSRYATSIVYHIRNQHLNDKPYVCALCGKCFAIRTNLNNHKKVHKKR